MAKEHNCVSCPRRKYYDKNPKSFGGKLWRWHINWCPGFSGYMKSLDEATFKEVQVKYQWKMQ